MTLILDWGGLTALAGKPAIVKKLAMRGQWPPIVPAGVLPESLTGDHRRDVHTNRLLRICVIKPVTELIARHAAVLRHRAHCEAISAVDAIVAATADHAGGGVWTSDPKDLQMLADQTINEVQVEAV